MALEFALRVDGDASSALAMFLATLGAYFIVREVAGEAGANVHMHALIITDVVIKNVRNRLLKKFPDLSGNKAYSLTVVEDSEKYRRYLCKGESSEKLPEVVGRQGIEFDDDWVAARHAAYWEVNEQLLAARNARKRTVFERVFQECVDEEVRWDKDIVIAKKYIRELSKDGKGINLFAVRSQINLLQIRLCPDDSALDCLAEKIADRR